MAVLLGLAASVLIGCGDFLARHCTRRSNAFTTTTVALVGGVLISGAFVPLLGGRPIGRDIWLGALSGLFIGGALALLYHAMVVSSAAVASPIVAVGTALIPLGWAVIGGSRPNATVLVGVAVALAGILVVTISPHLEGRLAAGVGFATLAAVAFGVALTLVGRTDPESGMWPAFAQRAAALGSMTMLTVARSQRLTLPRRLGTIAFVSGLFGAAGIASYVAGTQRGELGTVAVAASLFPAVTAVLAAVFDGDTLRWWQLVGIAVVLVGVGMMATG